MLLGFLHRSRCHRRCCRQCLRHLVCVREPTTHETCCLTSFCSVWICGLGYKQSPFGYSSGCKHRTTSGLTLQLRAAESVQRVHASVLWPAHGTCNLTLQEGLLKTAKNGNSAKHAHTVAGARFQETLPLKLSSCSTPCDTSK